jgi:L-ascorbate metabolism protein UlaG (beta-lactamase superfamily)
MAADLRITYLGHATLLIELDGVRVLTDPLLRDRLGPLRRHGPMPDAGTIGRLDAILVSHAHPDHFDRASLRSLTGGPVLLVPPGLGGAAGRTGHAVTELATGRSVDVGDVTVTAVAARHWRWPAMPRARTIGFLLEGSTSVYFAGDTGFFARMEALRGRVDVALLPVGRWGPHPGPIRLGPKSASRVARVVGARVAIPIHWGTFYPVGLHRVWPDALLEPARLFADAAAREAPGVEVRILQPGETTRVG